MTFTYFCTGIVIFLIIVTVIGGLSYITTSSDGDWPIIAWGVSSFGLAVFLTEFLIRHGII